MLVAVVGLFAMSAAAAPVFSTAAKLQDYVGPLAGCVTPSPDGAHVYVASEDADAIAIFERAPDTGFLTHARAQHGRRLYVVAGAGVYAIDREPATGQLALADLVRLPGPGFGGALSCDRSRLYASSWEGTGYGYDTWPRNAVTTLAIPEPATALTVAASLAALGTIVRHRRAA